MENYLLLKFKNRNKKKIHFTENYFKKNYKLK